MNSLLIDKYDQYDQRYSQLIIFFGTGSSGGIGKKGKELLKEIEKLNLILDVTHLCDQSFWETLDNYNGNLWASHSNTRTIVPKA